MQFFSGADSSQSAAMMSPFAGAGQQAAGPQDYNKLFKAERDNLAFSDGLYNWLGNDVENRILRKYGKIQ
jgi:ER membrane protein complex subunit 3